MNSGQTTSQPYGFEVKEQAFSGGKGIPIAGRYSGNSGEVNAIGEYIDIPKSDTHLALASQGNISFQSIPASGKYVVTIQNGQIQFVAAPEGDLQVFNNNLGWTPTESCDA
jgi:hypothetical protein